MIYKAYTDASILKGVAAGGAWVIYQSGKFFETHQLDLVKSGHPECVNSSVLAEAIVVRSIIRRLSKLTNARGNTTIYSDCKKVVELAQQQQLGQSILECVCTAIRINLGKQKFVLEWLPREQNHHADLLSKRQRINRVKDTLAWTGTVLRYDSETNSVTKKEY